MGAMLFVGLVLCIVVVIGFLIYGMYLGLASLAGHMRRIWWRIRVYEAQDLAARERASAAAVLEGDLKRPCWEIRGCSSRAREECPAYRRPEIPCWLASMQANPDGRLKPECLACKLFSIPALMTGV